MHIVERDKKQETKDVFSLSLGDFRTGESSPWFNLVTLSLRNQPYGWEVIPVGCCTGGRFSFRYKVAQSHREIYLPVDWNGYSACVIFVNPRWRCHIGLRMQWKQKNTYKSEAKSSTVVIPVLNPRPCGFSHVNIFLKKMNFEIRTLFNWFHLFLKCVYFTTLWPFARQRFSHPIILPVYSYGNSNLLM